MPVTSQPIESFETNRIVADRLTMQDFEDLNNIHQNPEAMATLGGVRSKEQNHEYHLANIKHWEDHGFGLWIFRTKEGTLMGRGGLRTVQIENSQEIELAYGLLPEYWGQGLATEIAKESIKIAFENYQLNNLICYTRSNNQASIRVMQKVGFQFERALTLYDEPHVLYRLTNSHYKNGTEKKEIETARLLIRPFRDSDNEDLFFILSDPDVMRFSLNGPYSRPKTEEFITGAINSYQKRGFGPYAVLLKENQTLIGFCGFFPQQINHKNEIELGYRLAKKYWGNGYATEAASACFKYALEKLNIKRLISCIEPNNTASIRVAEKVGLKSEGDSTFHGIPILLYAINVP
ncbi:MAG: GNAT family N-acetyltransferase [Candidatus Berkiellales bacterium]